MIVKNIFLTEGILAFSETDSADLSPVGEDDAEGHNAEDEEARGAGGDD